LHGGFLPLSSNFIQSIGVHHASSRQNCFNRFGLGFHGLGFHSVYILKGFAMSQNALRAFAKVKAKRQQHNIGQSVNVQIFGREVLAKIIAVHPFGTVDVETPSGFYRISGLALSEQCTN